MNLYSVTDLRQRTNEVINAALASGYVPIIQNSKNRVSMVDSQYFKTLQETYEDYLDIQELERLKSKKEPTITLEEHMKKYKTLHRKHK